MGWEMPGELREDQQEASLVAEALRQIRQTDRLRQLVAGPEVVRTYQQLVVVEEEEPGVVRTCPCHPLPEVAAGEEPGVDRTCPWQEVVAEAVVDPSCPSFVAAVGAGRYSSLACRRGQELGLEPEHRQRPTQKDFPDRLQAVGLRVTRIGRPLQIGRKDCSWLQCIGVARRGKKSRTYNSTKRSSCFSYTTTKTIEGEKIDEVADLLPSLLLRSSKTMTLKIYFRSKRVELHCFLVDSWAMTPRFGTIHFFCRGFFTSPAVAQLLLFHLRFRARGNGLCVWGTASAPQNVPQRNSTDQNRKWR